MGRQKNTIYVQIAAYRDPELIPTIKDCIEQAKYPGNLRFGIAWQHSPYDDFDDLSEFKNDYRFRIIDIDYRDAKGVPYARYLLNKKYGGEKYTLQLDSHHRFEKNWDVDLIKMIKDLERAGYEKPLLSSYVPSYEPTTYPEGSATEPWIMEFDRFAPEGPVHFLPHSINNFRELDLPVPTRFVGGHFIFTYGKYCKEVEYDPQYYFHGEEINLSIRSYMAGYDLFAPHKICVYHEYQRDGKQRHWDDHGDWDARDKDSHAHHRRMFGMDGNPPEIENEDYPRTLRDYERYAGLEFSSRRVHPATLHRQPPPVSLTDEEHEEGLVSYQRVCIDLYKQSVPEEDYNVWVIAFEDVDGEEFHRDDAYPDEIAQIIRESNEGNHFYQIWRNFYADEHPVKWIVWPHSESKGWGERLEGYFNVG